HFVYRLSGQTDFASAITTAKNKIAGESEAFIRKLINDRLTALLGDATLYHRYQDQFKATINGELERLGPLETKIFDFYYEKFAPQDGQQAAKFELYFLVLVNENAANLIFRNLATSLSLSHDVTLVLLAKKLNQDRR